MTASRRGLVISLAAALAAPRVLFAQPKRGTKTWRIGVLAAESAAGYARRHNALRAGLREMGYAEGKNIVFEYRYADGKHERLPELVADMVSSKVDVIVTSGTPPTRAAKQATAIIPIVMAASGDAVATGLVAGLARPGGNVTGSTFLSPELNAKRLELIKEALPRIRVVAYVNNLANTVTAQAAKAMEQSGGVLTVSVRRFDVKAPAELPAIFGAMAKSRIDAVVVGQDSMIVTNYKRIAELAALERLPTIGAKEYGEAGGLFGYGHDAVELYRRAAIYVDKILKGAKPTDLPIERPTKFELVINMKAANALGISVPSSILHRADKVIE